MLVNNLMGEISNYVFYLLLSCVCNIVKHHTGVECMAAGSRFKLANSMASNVGMESRALEMTLCRRAK